MFPQVSRRPATLVGMRTGVLFGVAAYGLWGLFPLYFPLVDRAGPVELLAHRIGWSLLFVGAFLALRRQLGPVGALLRDRRRLRLLTLSAVMIAGNWGLYIYAVTTDRVIEAALGYFINPLLSVGLGLALFGERLRPAQTAALGLGTVAVVVLAAFSATGFPWIAVSLAVLFAGYGLVKKLADVGAAEGLMVETLVLAGPAALFLGVLAARGDGTFTTEGVGHALLLVAAGPVTAIPLVLFSACVTRVPLSTVGLLQYLAPVLQFLIGWLVAGETMPAARWAGFALVWTALVVLSADALRASAAGRRAATGGDAEPQPMVA